VYGMLKKGLRLEFSGFVYKSCVRCLSYHEFISLYLL
jgi:hypothetical protein